ncbi:hypothetical protein AWU82_29625 [Pseudomonas glycinae]|uniref:Secreted protein n=1 Tax=Pseudomonas glycinae TaxID=1785145 RepID=A0ABN5FPL4_9PSED|nr:hypothetical protein AWU82_29625 [Pseudomonas glycinae]
MKKPANWPVFSCPLFTATTTVIVPTLCVGMPHLDALRPWDAERPRLHSHAERGNDLTRRISGGSGVGW